MYKKLYLFGFILMAGAACFGQDDTTPNIFEKLTSAAKNFRLDTSAAPADRITAKINELRSLRGGFNINEVMQFKIEEDRQKKETPAKDLDVLAAFFTSGKGKYWLDNAVTWIYREHFTYRELKKIVKFYRTTAGQKMATDFPAIMIKSLQAAEMIADLNKK